MEEARRQEQEAAPSVEFHADNEQTVRLFLSLQTQWRVAVGMTGVVWLGLDYAAVPAVMRLLEIPRVEQREAFAGLRIMESAAVRVLNTKADEDERG